MPFRTIAEIMAEGGTIGAYCGQPCWHHSDLDLPALVRRFGLDFEVSAYTINPRLRCTVCGQKRGTIRRHDVYKPIAMYDTHGNIGEKQKALPGEPG